MVGYIDFSLFAFLCRGALYNIVKAYFTELDLSCVLVW